MSGSLHGSLLNKEKNFPIWFMRQAGRYLPEYQKIRKKYKNFIKFCLNVNDATKVSLQPINRFNLDAAIVFSDILLILNAAGQKIEFKEKIGPILEHYDLNQFYKTTDQNFTRNLENVYKILRKIRKKLPQEKSLIGFAGSPWTLLTYMINRGPPKKNINFLKDIKKKDVIKIIKRLEHLIYIHCEKQILAGADIIQLFDSWAGLIGEANLREFCISPNKNIVDKIKKNFPNNPVICFPKGINKNINYFIKEVNPHGISIDYDINLKKLNLNNKVVFQGGMNPKFLLGNNKQMFKQAKKYLDFFKDKPYVFNLGHGILPKTKPGNVTKLVEFVRSYNL
ncbi:MAG: uroporphyrinogen decarboxylase [Candidatus Fonsibacter sp.]|nr:uroporphyrinogen decarboxylase [Candidatus Fonsibacter sp.]